MRPATSPAPSSITFDRHSTSATSPTVLFDAGRYRCWYSARLNGEPQQTTVDQGRVMELKGSALACAESTDGFTWTKPLIRYFADTVNIAGRDHLGQFTMNAAIFAGEQIEINARTARAGSIEVELREYGQPINGYTFADSIPANGDML